MKIKIFLLEVFLLEVFMPRLDRTKVVFILDVAFYTDLGVRVGRVLIRAKEERTM